jgi:hypothetical protein
MAIALSTLLAIAVNVTADPSSLTLGKDTSGKIAVRVTGAFGHSVKNANVTLSTNLGTVSNVDAAGDGTFTARYTPPKSRAPAVALLAADAEVDGDHAVGWLALPLLGSDSMALETKPRSTVQVRIADREFGPVEANAKGEVQIEVVVPPGVNKATMHIEDPLGNTADRQIDLDPPPFERLRVVPVGPPRVGPGESLEMQAFVIRRDGSGDPDARVSASADRGEVDVSRNRRGIVAVSWEPPRGASGEAAIAVESQGERAELRASILSLPQSTRGSWTTRLGTSSFALLGSGGAATNGSPILGATAESAIALRSTPFELLLDVGTTRLFPADETAPATFLGRTERARATSLSAELGIRGTSSMSGFDVHAALLLGVQETWVSATSGGTPSISRTDSQLGLRASAAAGASWRAGPGRILVQLQTSVLPFSAAGLQTPLGGFALQAGYALPLSR